jgi:hypothetical protein
LSGHKKGNEISEVCSTHGRDEKYIILCEELNLRDDAENLDVDGRMISNGILGEWGWRLFDKFFYSGQEAIDGFF